MYNYEDILIIGDSFCGNRNHAGTWPYRLLTHLTGKNEKQVRGQGFPGASWWSTRVELLDHLNYGKCPKILILTHTEPTRIPSDYNFPLNTVSVFDKHEKNRFFNINKSAQPYNKQHLQLTCHKDIIKAAQLYYKYLISEEFHEWAIYKWFHELDSILFRFNIPIIIHIYSFDTTMWARYNNRYTFKTGVTSLETLYELQISIDEDKRNVDKDQNHFPLEHNHLIADSLYEFLMKYDSSMNGTIVDFNLLKR